MISSRNALSTLKNPATCLRTFTIPATRSKNINKRPFHTTKNMAFFPHLTTSGDFTPLFRLLDDYDVHRTSPNARGARSSIRTFAPRFDVREVKDAYHLDGELPGISQDNIEIEFTDPQSLVIKGNVKREYTKTNDDTAMNDVDETASRSSRQPTVEDEDAASTAVSKPSNEKQVSKQSTAPSEKYWISERSTGEFQRTFNFPERVDQDAVRANLKDGILSIVVPKAAPPVSKKIRVE